MAAGVAQSSSPFSLTFTIQQSQTVNGEQATLQQAFGNAAQFGSTISFFWDWGASDELPALMQDVKLAQALGFKVVVNMTSNEIPGVTAPPGYTPSFGNAATAAKYLQDVATVASLSPTYLNIYPEVNVLAAYNPAEFANYSSLYPQAYAVAKAASPNTLVGTSYLDLLWVGDHQQAMPYQLGPHDFIGITTYPFEKFASVQAIPDGWYTQWRAVYPTEKLLFTEVGWGSASPQTPESQAEYIAALPQLMKGVNPEVVAYALQEDGSFYDVNQLTPTQLAFYKAVGTDPAALFSEFNSSGLFHDNGTPKAAYYAATNLNFNVSPTPSKPLAVSDLVSKPTASTLGNLVDYDGNHLGAVGSWHIIGGAEVQPGGGPAFVLVNNDLGRWATLAPDKAGIIDLGNNGAGGNARVVGTYKDPLVAQGLVAAGSVADSQTRLTSDLKTGNLASILGSGDYNGDGLQEVYFSLADHSAFLHAFMHADGNVMYANYQSASQMHAYLQSNGYGSNIWGSWT